MEEGPKFFDKNTIEQKVKDFIESKGLTDPQGTKDIFAILASCSPELYSELFKLNFTENERWYIRQQVGRHFQ